MRFLHFILYPSRSGHVFPVYRSNVLTCGEGEGEGDTDGEDDEVAELQEGDPGLLGHGSGGL